MLSYWLIDDQSDPEVGELAERIRTLYAHFQDPEIPLPSHRDANVTGPCDVSVVCENALWWDPILATASSEYESGIIGRDWWADGETRSKYAADEIYDAGRRIREAKGPHWQPEYGTPSLS